jgi:hypothetical protein
VRGVNVPSPPRWRTWSRAALDAADEERRHGWFDVQRGQARALTAESRRHGGLSRSRNVRSLAVVN